VYWRRVPRYDMDADVKGLERPRLYDEAVPIA
jgi:hypothetical protein